MKTFLIRGVPTALQQDGWWLNAPPPPKVPKEASAQTPDILRLGLLVTLIALGDVLVWQVLPGLSLAVFGAAIVLAAVLAVGVQMSLHHQGQIAAATTLVLCPLVELVQPLSLMIAVVGVSLILATVAGLKWGQLGRGVLRLWPCGLLQSLVDLRNGLRGTSNLEIKGRVGLFVMRWLMPMALGLIFVCLLLIANPIAERWANNLWDSGMQLLNPVRMAFWLCLAPVGWTALSLAQMRERLRAAPRPVKFNPKPLGLINAASVSRALVIFNTLFALQTAMDVIFLYGGVGLPEGISYAEYAHRGAYPLVVTGLLAGSFALLCRRWVKGDDLLRGLLMLFVAQNLALVVSSLVRLALYVEVYGLTHLRMAAAIWMGLTAAGLGLILWQVWRGRNIGWLIACGGGLSVVVLYLCAFISFDATIARYNLNHEVAQDYHYICGLGDAAKPAIAAHDPLLCGAYHIHIAAPNDWREWGFRNWRARTSLAALANGYR